MTPSSPSCQTVYLFITVPAFQFLWSGHDVFLQHYRRYSLTRLRQLVNGNGLEVRQAHYFFGTAFPLVASMRLKDKLLPSKQPQSSMRNHSSVLNRFAYGVCRAEIALMRLNRVAGLSVVMLAQKPKDNPFATLQKTALSVDQTYICAPDLSSNG